MHYGKLTPAKIERYRLTGKPCSVKGDGDGLWIQLSKSRTLSWVFRWTEPRVVEGVRGKGRRIGLGAYPNVTNLEDARKERYRLKQLLKDGGDPEEDRERKKTIAAHERGLVKTVNEVIDEYINIKIDVPGKAERTKKRNLEMLNEIRRGIGPLPIALVDTKMLLEKMNIESLLKTRFHTTKYVLNRCENVFERAIFMGYYKKKNPARWKGYLDKMLPNAEDIGHEITHRDVGFKWREMGWFMEKLRAHRLQSNGSWARGGERSTISLWLEFAALTGCRVNEARVAKWNNIDRDTLTWTVPPGDNKIGSKQRSEKSKEERSILRPITKPMLDVLDEMDRRWPGHARDAFIFRSDAARAKDGAPYERGAPHGFIYGTLKWPSKLHPHGFRDVMKNWSRSQHPQWVHLIELQFGHNKKGDKTEQAYGRDGLLNERRPLMQFWADYCSKPAPEPISDGSNVDQSLAERRKAAS